nr:hypothetical protein BACY1_13590 [Tenacibaculum mesophilum]
MLVCKKLLRLSFYDFKSFVLQYKNLFQMTLDVFKQTIQNTPKKVEFSDTISVIESLYSFTPTAFKMEVYTTKLKKIKVRVKYFRLLYSRDLVKKKP